MSTPPDDTTTTPLSDLCAICHTTPPKYRCPRCHTRTCSLPCSRRHKLWSQCSGTRDPGAYLRRSELASESAFDRDFNFISGVERSVERAERDAENRGISVDRVESEDAAMRKRKRGKGPGPAPGPGLDVGDGAGGGAGGGRGLAKGEAAFLRGAADAAVTVVRAPKGMSREKGNSSRWFPKQKCLNWSVEWILPDRNKVTRDYIESTTLADAYDRVSPPPKEESVGFVHVQLRGQPPGPEMTTRVAGENMQEDSTAGHSTAGPETQPEQHTHASADSAEITPHRDLYFYLHRPRTATKPPVLIPVSPNVTLTTALRGRTVLEFPTIYVLPDSPGTVLTEKGHLFLLEEEYLRTERPAEDAAEVADTNAAEGVGDSLATNSVDLGQVDEQKVLDVLKQDLFGGSAAS